MEGVAHGGTVGGGVVFAENLERVAAHSGVDGERDQVRFRRVILTDLAVMGFDREGDAPALDRDHARVGGDRSPREA